MAAFGSVFMPQMALTRFEQGAWSTPQIVAADSISLHPGAHVLHYASTCFEGLKAFRHEDGGIYIAATIYLLTVLLFGSRFFFSLKIP